jgi:hypothetical protein
MIAIINRTEHRDYNYGGTYGIGKQLYSLQVNDNYLTKFEHNFEDGLATCLLRAYEAAKRWENEQSK